MHGALTPKVGVRPSTTRPSLRVENVCISFLHRKLNFADVVLKGSAYY